MNKIAIFLCTIALTVPAFAEKNIFFGEKINSITLYGAQSTGSGSLLKLI